MRNLVVCLDGTWNNAEQGKARAHEHEIYLPTNVLKLYRAVVPFGSAGPSQIAYYSEGVGSFVGDRSGIGRLQVWADRAIGGAVGGGFESRIKSAYRFLVGNYSPGDRIFVFGFSRGAAEAQALVRFIDWAGGLLRKSDEYWIVELFEHFRDTHAASGAAAALRSEILQRARSHMDPPQPVEIDLLGVFDTVLSLGYRFLADFREGDIPTVAPKFAFYVGKTPPAIVKTVRHALAIDEKRWDFRPQIWTSRAAENPAQSLVQLWFPGVHSNVGGGYGNDGFANGSLQWMVAEAETAGLLVDRDFLKYYRPDIRGHEVDSDVGGVRTYEILRGKRDRGVRTLDAGADAGIGVHGSAASRLIADPAYRPANLLAYLAQDAARIDQLRLATAQETEVRALVGRPRGSPQ